MASASSSASSGSRSSSSSSGSCRIETFEITQGSWQISAGGNAYQPCNMDATFQSSGGGRCGCCEYRQFIRGWARTKQPGDTAWAPVILPLKGGKVMLPNEFREDGSGSQAYGYRSQTWGQNSVDKYTPSPRSTACNYAGYDEPGWHNAPLPSGTQFQVDIEFSGRIVNICGPKETIIQEKTWRVQKEGTFP
jgi:hypothetical protein